MSQHRTRLPSWLYQELTGLEWEVVSGSKHYKLLVAGQLVTVFSRGCPWGDARDFQSQNTRRAIRNARRRLESRR